MIIYAVDFDGTLCEECFPKIGEPKQHVIDFLKNAKQTNNVKLILWTCREEVLLQEAIAWCKKQGLTFDAINTNLPEQCELYQNDPRKVGATFYIDDRAIHPDMLGKEKQND